MNVIALFLLAGMADPAAVQDNGSSQAQPKKERLICKRFEATESRMGSKRVCRTAKEWRDAQDADSAAAVRRGRASDNN